MSLAIARVIHNDRECERTHDIIVQHRQDEMKEYVAKAHCLRYKRIEKCKRNVLNVKAIAKMERARG